MTSRPLFAFASPTALLLVALACATTEEVTPVTETGGTTSGSGGVVATGGVTMTGGVGITGGAVTGGAEVTGGVDTAGGTSTGGLPPVTGGTTTGTGGIPEEGEDGADCTWPQDCDSLVCVNTRCACGNGLQDGNETGIDCGGSCPPCADEPCGSGFKPCGGGLVCEAGTCVPHCLTGWRDTAEGIVCLEYAQDDWAMCAEILDCMMMRNCAPAPCDTCDSNLTTGMGSVGNDKAMEVYRAMCE